MHTCINEAIAVRYSEGPLALTLLTITPETIDLPVPDMTYNVFSGTLNHTQSINLDLLILTITFEIVDLQHNRPSEYWASAERRKAGIKQAMTFHSGIWWWMKKDGGQ